MSAEKQPPQETPAGALPGGPEAENSADLAPSDQVAAAGQGGDRAPERRHRDRVLADTALQKGRIEPKTDVPPSLRRIVSEFRLGGEAAHHILTAADQIDQPPGSEPNAVIDHLLDQLSGLSADAFEPTSIGAAPLTEPPWLQSLLIAIDRAPISEDLPDYLVDQLEELPAAAFEIPPEADQAVRNLASNARKHLDAGRSAAALVPALAQLRTELREISEVGPIDPAAPIAEAALGPCQHELGDSVAVKCRHDLYGAQACLECINECGTCHFLDGQRQRRAAKTKEIATAAGLLPLHPTEVGDEITDAELLRALADSLEDSRDPLHRTANARLYDIAERLEPSNTHPVTGLPWSVGKSSIWEAPPSSPEREWMSGLSGRLDEVERSIGGIIGGEMYPDLAATDRRFEDVESDIKDHTELLSSYATRFSTLERRLDGLVESFKEAARDAVVEELKRRRKAKAAKENKQ